ncbi:DUF1090 domain-containing protein [Halomonas elongata]|uniref:DUF1090 domain-containing protein n=1 Tax=Halomonas elongata TaxID=2746 RepID=UPI0038D4C7B2
MKRTFFRAIPAMVLAMPIAFSQPVLAAETMDSLCQTKAEHIQKQLRIAKEYGNEHRVRGLEKSLEGVQRHCSNERVIEGTEEDVRESMEEVRERQAELAEAQQEGDMDDIRKRSEKLEEAVMELKERQNELEALQSKQ